jgi:uncharacterized protein involved in exopolysaccharide biosynthesis
MSMSDDPLFDAPERAKGEAAFTKRDFLRLAFEHWRPIVITFVVVSASLGAALLYLPPTYVAEGKLLVQTEKLTNPSFFGGIATYRDTREADPVNRRIETEMELISTRVLSERVITGLDLRYKDVFHPAYMHLLNPIADLYDGVQQRLFGKPPRPDKYGFAKTVRDFNHSFSVAPLKSKSAETTSNLIHVQLRAPDPKIARASLQQLLEGYVDFTVNIQQSSGVEAHEVVKRNLEQAREQMEIAQGRMHAFLARLGPSADPENGVRKVRLASAFNGNGGDGADREGIATPADDAWIRQAPTDEPGLRTLRGRLTDMELRLAETRRSYQEDSEQVQLLVSGVADLRKRVERGFGESANHRMRQLQLERELRTAEEQHSELKKRLGQISLFLAANLRQSDIRTIVEPPLEPSSSEWRTTLLVWVLGSIGGLILGFAIAGFFVYGDHRLQTSEDVRRFLGTTLLAVVPALDPRDLKKLETPEGAMQSEGSA